MSPTLKSALGTLAGLAVLVFAVWAVVSASIYNADRTAECEARGLVFGREFMGDYGCVELHPFDTTGEQQ